MSREVHIREVGRQEQDTPPSCSFLTPVNFPCQQSSALLVLPTEIFSIKVRLQSSPASQPSSPTTSLSITFIIKLGKSLTFNRPQELFRHCSIDHYQQGCPHAQHVGKESNQRARCTRQHSKTCHRSPLQAVSQQMTGRPSHWGDRLRASADCHPSTSGIWPGF